MCGRTTTRGRAIAALIAAALVAGCSAVLPTPSVDTYDLRGPEASATPQGRSLQVLVPEPTTDRAFDTDRIVVRPGATEVAYFGGAQWVDRLPRLVQSRLAAALEASGRFRAAGRPGQGLAIDRQMLVEIRDFAYEAKAGRVTIVLAVKLMDDRTGRIMAAETFRAEAPSADDARSAVAALDGAQTRLLADVVAWAAKRG